ncbi:uncharacterized protein LOC143184207 [Calliopsis andreniformis]|uniref:uncharacterized protein LOC143184207 n=1 Tax=Calliopsis andreniformis TaxID=337506 RepID=UPI003FCD1E44
MTDFAKAQLMKYGWTEGKGLGKNETGITEAIRPKLKFDKAGIDHKDTDHKEWWETAFNNAVNNIVIESQSHGVSISVSKKESSEDNLKEKKSKYMSSYTNFLKTSTLIHGNIIQEKSSDLPEVDKIQSDVTYVPLTDEELFKVCGGRTAHKGARHGLTLQGKLKRIAQQEEDLLNTTAYTSVSDKLKKYNEVQDSCKIDDNENVLPVALSSEEESNAPKLSKSKRKKHKRRINDLTHQLNILCNVSDNDERSKHSLVETEVKIKHKKKKMKKESAVTQNIQGIGIEEEDNEIDNRSFPVNLTLEKNVKEKSVEGQVNDQIEEEFENIFTRKKKKKKSKRKKDQNEQDGNVFTLHRVKKLKNSYKGNLNVQHIIEDGDNMLENKFQIELPCDKPIMPSDKIKDLLEHPEAALLNARIVKKKEAKHHRKQKARLDKIITSLEAVHFDAEKSAEKKKDSKKRLNRVVEKMVEYDIAANKTESLKKSVKKKKTNKNK